MGCFSLAGQGWHDGPAQAQSDARHLMLRSWLYLMQCWPASADGARREAWIGCPGDTAVMLLGVLLLVYLQSRLLCQQQSMLIAAMHLQSCSSHLMMRLRPAATAAAYAPAQCRGVCKAWLGVLARHQVRNLPCVAPGAETFGLLTPAGGAVKAVHNGKPAAVVTSQQRYACIAAAASSAAQARTCPWQRCHPLTSGADAAVDGHGGLLQQWGSEAAGWVPQPLPQRLAVKGVTGPHLHLHCLLWQM